jgi:hypothetical protein
VVVVFIFFYYFFFKAPLEIGQERRSAIRSGVNLGHLPDNSQCWAMLQVRIVGNLKTESLECLCLLKSSTANGQ